MLVAFTALAAITLIVAALLLATGEPKVVLATSRAPHPQATTGPASAGKSSTASASAPVEWILLFLAIVALGFAAWLWSNWGRSRPPTAPA